MTFFTPTPETRVNTTVIGEQYGSYRSGNMSALDNGNYVVVWTSQDAGVAGIYMQRFDMFGTPIGVETKVNTFTGFDIIPSVTNLTGGGFVVTWTSQNGQDGAGNGVYMQRYNASGVRQGVETLVNTTTTGNQDAARVFSLPAGGYIVVWDGEGSAQDTSNYGVFFQRYDASGNKVGGETLANTTTTNYQDSGSALVNADGSFMVIWESAGQDYGTGYGVYMQRFDATGAKIGSETLVNTTVVNHQLYPTGEVLTGGDIIVTWTSNLQDGSGAGVYTQRFTAAGARVGGEVLVNTSTNLEQNGSRVTALADGGYIVQWESNAEDGAHWNLYIQRYDAAGAKIGGETLVNTRTLGDQSQGAVTTLTDGSFVVSWQSWGQDQATGWGVYQRIFHAGETYNDAAPGGHVVTGGTGDDIVNGLDGADTLYGGGDARGHDTLNGGDGDDNIYMTGGDTANGGNNNDHIWVTAFTAEALYANGGSGYDIFDITLTTGNSYWQFVDASSIEEYRGNAQNDNFDGSLITGLSTLTLAGNGGNDTLKSGAGNDVIDGGAGNDLLDGGTGADNMSGRADNDTYIVDNTGDIVIELNGQGVDTVLSSVSFSLATNFAENLTLTGSANIDGTGNGLNNVLTGNAGINTLIGGSGDDTYIVNNIGDVVVELFGKGTDLVQSTVTYSLATNFAENLTLTGSDNVDATGNGLGNILTGNSGINTLSGGLGDDTYIVNNTSDVVIELNGKGTDLVQSSVSYSIASNFVENLTLTGLANIDGTGNGLANTLTGNAGNNRLNGGVGADTLVGGSGDDTYVVDDAGDVVTELYARGIDLVQSSVTYSLATNFADNLTLTGSANIDATGNGLANILTGNSGINTLSGGLGDDTYVVNNIGDVVVELFGKGTDLVKSSVSYSIASNFVDNLILTGVTNIDAIGNGLANILTGNAGNNSLNGAAGADTLVGGSGDDTYVVDNAGDVVTELYAKGIDLVQSSVTYSLATNFADNLTLTGAANIDATGNGLSNVLTGNAGINTLSGGLGDDTYIVNNTGDVVVELNGKGTDLVQSSVSYSIATTFVENLTLTGSAIIDATGNALDNIMIGNTAANILLGGGGRDTLTGDLGADRFRFTLGSGLDTITDFHAAQNDLVDIHAYTAGVVSIGLLSTVGGDTVINLGGGNVITVVGVVSTDPGLLAHIVW